METSNKFYLCSDSETLFDQNYRYQVDNPIISNSFKKGHPITKFENYKSFASSLNINENILIKLVGNKLWCQVGFDDNFAYFKGTYNYDIIVQIIQNIVVKFILCKNCDRPEVVIRVKNKKLQHKCSACGSKYYLDDNGDKSYDIMIKSLT